MHMGYEEHETWIQYAISYGTRSSSCVGKDMTRPLESVLNEKKKNRKKKKERKEGRGRPSTLLSFVIPYSQYPYNK